MTAEGLQPQLPADLRTQIVGIAEILSPGITTDLPGTLIEDIASTDVGAVVVSDQARVDFIASITPRGASPFLLRQLGAIYGVPLGLGTNTTVYVVFTGPPGFAINKGFQVSDGTYTYIIQVGGAIQIISTVTGSGVSQPLLALASQTGSWSVGANSVQQILTSVPQGVSLSVTNPLPGIPGLGGQTEESYRADVLQAGIAAAQGTPAFVKTSLLQVPGTSDRLISMKQQSTGAWSIICGGSGDPNLVASAIYSSMPDINVLVGSTMFISNITNNAPGVVTTVYNHGLPNLQTIQIHNAQGMSGINDIPLIITVISPTVFSINLDTTSLGTYQAGSGYVTPNFRNVVINKYDYPDIYSIPIIIPPLQTVTINLLWNTIESGFISTSSVAQAGAPALSNYVNSIAVGQPINVFEMNSVFQAAVSTLISIELLTRMAFTVAIDGVAITPQTGTGIIQGDPESYLVTDVSSIVINQG